MSEELPAPTSGVKGRPVAERGAQTGDGAELGEATASPTITVAAPRSDPGRPTAERARRPGQFGQGEVVRDGLSVRAGNTYR